MTLLRIALACAIALLAVPAVAATQEEPEPSFEVLVVGGFTCKSPRNLRDFLWAPVWKHPLPEKEGPERDAAIEKMVVLAALYANKRANNPKACGWEAYFAAGDKVPMYYIVSRTGLRYQVMGFDVLDENAFGPAGPEHRFFLSLRPEGDP